MKAALAKSTPLDALFDDLESLLQPYAPSFSVITGSVKNKRDIHLISKKEMTIAGRKRNELYFVSLIAQKGYVGFYYMPIYCEPALLPKLGSALQQLLKGKCCFHVKSLTPELKSQIQAALQLGQAQYEKNGWV